MPTFIVALDSKSRHARSAFGKFSFMAAHQRLVWRKEETDDIVRLAELVNEATPFLRSYGSLPHGLVVLQVDKEEPQAVSEPATQEPEEVEQPAAEDLAAALGEQAPVFEPELTEDELADLENSGDQTVEEPPIENPLPQKEAVDAIETAPEPVVTPAEPPAETPAVNAQPSETQEPPKPKRKLRKKKDENATGTI